jgi:3-oxoadipate enol-lactonase
MPVTEVNGINIYYEVQGQGDPLVLIAGFGSTIKGWMNQVPVFKQHYQVIMFDNRGIGKSDKPKGPYRAKMMADDTIGLMDHLGIKKAHILGCSMGGGIAQELVLKYPDRVNKLILASTSALRNDGPDGGTQAFFKILRLPIRKLMYNLVSLAMNKTTAKMIYVPMVWIQSRFTNDSDETGLRGQIDAVVNYSTPHDKLLSIKCPVLVITGSKDRVVKPSSSDTLAKLIPDTRLVKLENGSHMVNFEMSKVFNIEILRFLQNR